MKFEVIGTPQGKARPRFFRGHAVTPKETKEYERRIALAYKSAGGRCLVKGENSPVAVRLTMVYSPNKSDSKKRREAKINGYIVPTKKPDADNCLKAVLDALQGGVAFYDDKQVTWIHIQKVYGEEAKLVVEVENIDEQNDDS